MGDMVFYVIGRGCGFICVEALRFARSFIPHIRSVIHS